MVRQDKKSEKRLTLLLHPLRREIYRLVCETPGTYFFELSNLLMAPQGTVNWHLRKLEKAGLLSSEKFKGKRVYYSRNLRHEEVEKAFVVLKAKTARKIFAFIINNDNCHQITIARGLNIHHDTVSHHTKKMVEVKLINQFKNGRKTCYTMGDIGRKIQEESISTISETYIASLVGILEDNCLNPEIEEVSKDAISIRLECPGQTDATFTISLGQWSFDEDDYDEEEDKGFGFEENEKE